MAENKEWKVDRVLLESVKHMADHGFHGTTIARVTGLSVSQVYYRTKVLGTTLRAYRNGYSAAAKNYIKLTPCVELEVKATRGTVYHVQSLVGPKK